MAEVLPERGSFRRRRRVFATAVIGLTLWVTWHLAGYKTILGGTTFGDFTTITTNTEASFSASFVSKDEPEKYGSHTATRLVDSDQETLAGENLNTLDKRASKSRSAPNESPTATNSHLLLSFQEKQQRACQNLPESLAQLRQALRENPNTTAVRPWSNSQYAFAGLDSRMLQQVFHKRKTIFLGDSTLYYMVKWLRRALVTKPAQGLDNLSSLNLTAANALINPTSDHSVGFHGIPKSIRNALDGTHITWQGFAGGDDPNSTDYCSWTWDLTPEQPDVMVVNFGLHWLHLMGSRDLHPCVVERWWNYEQDWLHAVWQRALEARVQVLLYKTCNFICEDRFFDAFNTTNRLYRANDPVVLGECAAALQRNARQAAPPQERIERYCREGTFNQVGVGQLNNRLYKFVQDIQGQTPSTMYVGIFNDHDVQSCVFAEERDGIHYHSLNLMRLRLLGNMMECLLPT